MCAWQRHPVGAERTAAFYQPAGRGAAGLPADATTAMLPRSRPGVVPAAAIWAVVWGVTAAGMARAAPMG